MKVTLNFEGHRCKRGRAKSGASFCFQVKKAEKKHIVEFRLPDGKLIGFMGKDCRMVYDRKKAFLFKGGATATDQAAQACLRFMQKPGGKNPNVIYRRADQGKIT